MKGIPNFLIYVAGGGIIGRSDIWVLPMPGGPPAPFLDSTFIETQPQFSPDGRWVAYTSRESGQLEVYVTSFPDKRVKSVISVAGGSLPRWNRNGKEILYLTLDNTLIATPVNGAGPRFEVGVGRPLFRVRPRPTARLDAYPYDLTSDGRRILVNTFVEESTTNPITLVVNWTGVPNR